VERTVDPGDSICAQFLPIYAMARGLKVYEEFVEGAKEGFGVI